MIFLFNCVIFKLQPLIFRVVLFFCCIIPFKLSRWYDSSRVMDGVSPPNHRPTQTIGLIYVYVYVLHVFVTMLNL